MTATTLLINNNNSRTKFALATADGGVVADSVSAVETRPATAASFADALAGHAFDRAVMASVVPEKAALLRETLAAAGKPLVEVSHRAKLGLAVDFPKPETVGADRLANAAAVVALGMPLPVVVVDFGTAVTFDIIAEGPAYIGGVIAPGLDAMRDYLHQRTALLPRIDLREPPVAIGKSTVDAMLSGAVHGYRGMVREILSQVSRELADVHRAAAPPKIVATGGYADLIADGLPEIETVDPLLTLRGIARIGALTFSQP
ncbi:MAG: type III pantothenate kinase [Verrucomicrobiae bacterium]|nr:type III pantothenate kinase [Verrucomicrobiae bacterium]MCP5538907.1 type III pantothenate kinase [Akkermansiaceae bacterium]